MRNIIAEILNNVHNKKALVIKHFLIRCINASVDLPRATLHRMTSCPYSPTANMIDDSIACLMHFLALRQENSRSRTPLRCIIKCIGAVACRDDVSKFRCMKRTGDQKVVRQCYQKDRRTKLLTSHRCIYVNLYICVILPIFMM